MCFKITRPLLYQSHTTPAIQRYANRYHQLRVLEMAPSTGEDLPLPVACMWQHCNSSNHFRVCDIPGLNSGTPMFEYVDPENVVAWEELNNANTCSDLVPDLLAHADRWGTSDYQVDHCLSEKVAGDCGLNTNLPIVLVVIICNAVKVAAMLTLALNLKVEPLMTIGDAVRSFIDRPDEHSRGLCMQSGSQIEYPRDESGNPVAKTLGYYRESKPQVWMPKRARWAAAAPGGQWLNFIFL